MVVVKVEETLSLLDSLVYFQTITFHISKEAAARRDDNNMWPEALGDTNSNE